MYTFDFILLSYDKGLINENDFLLLRQSYISQNLHLPWLSQLLLEPPVIPTTKQNKLNTPGEGGGGLPYETDGDARKFWI